MKKILMLLLIISFDSFSQDDECPPDMECVTVTAPRTTISVPYYGFPGYTTYFTDIETPSIGDGGSSSSEPCVTAAEEALLLAGCLALGANTATSVVTSQVQLGTCGLCFSGGTAGGIPGITARCGACAVATGINGTLFAATYLTCSISNTSTTCPP